MNFSLESVSARVCLSSSALSFCLSRSASTRPLRCQQAPSDQIQVRQREGGEQPGGVLGQAPVTHLGEAPQALHDMEGVLAAGPNGRTQAVEPPLGRAESMTVVGPAVNPVANASGAGRLAMRLAPVRLV